MDGIQAAGLNKHSSKTHQHQILYLGVNIFIYLTFPAFAAFAVFQIVPLVYLRHIILVRNGFYNNY